MTIFTSNGRRLRLVAGSLAVSAVIYGVFSTLQAGGKRDDHMPVGLTGVHHLGRAYNIGEFYVNGYYGMNVGREGGGGTVCCVSLPKKWREGLKADVRWSINDWSNENRKEIEADNFSSVSSGGIFRAQVPVEKYETPEHLWVHFFPGGRVRVISSNSGPGGLHSPGSTG